MELTRGDLIVCASNGDYGKPRPAAVIQSNYFNSTHASITICPITTHLVEAPLFRILISPTKENGLKQPSQLMVDKIISIPREKIHQKIGILNKEQFFHLNRAIKLWLDLDSDQGERLMIQEMEYEYK